MSHMLSLFLKRSMRSVLLITGIVTMLREALPVAALYAATFEIFPSNADETCDEEFENVANKLEPGDDLVLHGGTYTQACRRLITGRNGTPANPIIIRAATGETPVLTRPGTGSSGYSQNNIEIENSSYLIIRGLTFRGGDSSVRFMGTNSNITFEDNEISDTSNNALALNSGNSDLFVIRRNHIHHTGLYASGSTEGEGMYLGCNNNTCRITNSIIDNNYIHHLRSTSSGGNDGIEVKVGSYGNIIRNNVIHDTNIGTQFPCIFVYGGGNGINTVEGNVMWNCGEGIYAVSDAVVRNNIVLNSSSGISSYPHVQVTQMKNITIVNNTIYGHPDCLVLRWSGTTNMIVANNAVYCGGNNAVNASGLSGSTITVQSNYVEGNMSGGSIDNIRFFNGGSAVSAFVNPAVWDFWLSANSPLRNTANATYVPTLDFNETPRSSPYDIGAYEIEGLTTNPGWRIAPGFKTTGSQSPLPAAPTNLRVR